MHSNTMILGTASVIFSLFSLSSAAVIPVRIYNANAHNARNTCSNPDVSPVVKLLLNHPAIGNTICGDLLKQIPPALSTSSDVYTVQSTLTETSTVTTSIQEEDETATAELTETNTESNIVTATETLAPVTVTETEQSTVSETVTEEAPEETTQSTITT